MLTPYDWQEGIGHRAQYIEAKLAQGSPVLAVSLPSGILVFTYRRQARKIYEIYDRLVFAAIGQQADVEAFRIGALEFASREAYNRSDEDVTIQRVANAMSSPLKRAFGDFGAAPIIARSLLAEVGDHPENDLYYVLDYDGDFAVSRRCAVVAGTLEKGAQLEERLKDFQADSVTNAVEQLQQIWQSADEENEERAPDLKPEAVLLERDTLRENRFRSLFPEEF